MTGDAYVRAVTLVDVIDGDTFRCDVDLGFYVRVRMSCRLAGINTAEHNQPGGPEARAELARLLSLGPVTVRSVRADKYAGRFDAAVTVMAQQPGERGLIEVAPWLIDHGLAVPWNGTGPRPAVPWPPTT